MGAGPPPPQVADAAAPPPPPDETVRQAAEGAVRRRCQPVYPQVARVQSTGCNDPTRYSRRPTASQSP
eukprot:gene17300-5380_t